MKQCEDNQFDLAVVDVPYEIKKSGHLKNEARSNLAISDN